MQKKVLIIALCLLAVVLLTVACTKNGGKDADTTYVPIDYTIGEDGEKYITNVYGDLIPVTTSKDGGMELMEDLFTKTKEQAADEKAELEQENQQTSEEPAGDNTNPSDNDTSNPQGGGMHVGTDSIRDHSDRDAVINW